MRKLACIITLLPLLYNHSVNGLPLVDQAKVITKNPHHYPVILVHGFMGTAELLPQSMHYWGGLNTDFQKSLNLNTGEQVFVADVGPLSSNFDRAVSLIAQIKGGCIVYGEAHSALYGHAVYYPNKRDKHYPASMDLSGKTQFPPFTYSQSKKTIKDARCFSGFYPEWDDKHPIHLIGHSQGGQTVRYAVSLLDNQTFRNDEGVKALLLTPNVDISSASVRSVTTVSSPGEGTTLTEVINKEITDLIPVIKIPSLSGTTLAQVAVYGIDKVNSSLLSKPINSYLFDIGLNQWTNASQSISKPAYELLSMPSTLQGVTDCQATSTRAENKTLARSCDLSRYDLSTAGAPDVTLNMIGNSSPNTYYFSIATRAPNDLQTKVDELYAKTFKEKGNNLTTAQKITALTRLPSGFISPLGSISSVANIAVSYASSPQNLGTIALRLQNPALNPSILTNPPLITAGISTSLIADAVSIPLLQSLENRLTHTGAANTIDSNVLSAWRDNDAVVNTFSMINPYMKPSELITNYQLGINNGNLACPKTKTEIADKLPIMMSNPQLSSNKANSWNFVCLLDGFDHMDSVGWLYTKDGASSADYMLEFYTKYIEQLERL